MEIKVFKKFPLFSAQSYLLIKNDKALLIDCGYLSDELLGALNRVTLCGLIITHGHFDHIRGIDNLKKLYPDLKIFYNQTNTDFLSNPINNCSRFANQNDVIINAKTISLSEGVHSVGGFDFEVIYTPGHTKDSMSILFPKENVIFTGDFLFPQTVGRCDLPTSSISDLEKSLKKIKPYINDELTIYCGHDQATNGKRICHDNQYIIDIFNKTF